jgi:YD repeat-containing protein
MKKIIVTILLFVFSPFARAQLSSLPGWGMKPGVGYENSPIDSINHENGNLVLHIPIVSIPQAGDLPPFTIEVTYNSSNWVFTPFLECECTPYVYYYTWVYQGSGVAIGRTDIPTYFVSGINIGGGSIASYSYISTTMGGLHPLHPLVNSNVWKTTDGSGFLWNYVQTTTSSSNEIVDGNGISYTDACTQRDPESGYCSAGQETNIESDHFGHTVSEVIGFNQKTYIDSFGHTLQVPDPSQSCQTINYPSATGTSPYTFCWANINIATSFDDPGMSEANESEGTAQITTLSSISTPEGSYTFTYDSWGDLQSLTLPRGGSITYGWTSTVGSTPTTWGRSLVSRTVNDANGNQNKFQYTLDSNGLKVIYPSQDYVQYGPDYNGFSPASNIYYDSSGHVIKTEIVTKNVYISPYDYLQKLTPFSLSIAATLTTWPDGSTSQICDMFVTDSTSNCTGANSNISVVNYYDENQHIVNPGQPQTNYPLPMFNVGLHSETGFGNGSPGPLMRNTRTRYKWQDSSDYLNQNFLNVVSSVTTEDGAGNKVAETDMEIDGAGDGLSGVLGKTSAIDKWLNTTGQYLSTQIVYNSDGRPTTVQDANGNKTTIAYQCNGKYVSTSTNPKSQTTTYSYDCNTGLVTGIKTPNDSMAGRAGTTMVYDAANALTSTTFPSTASKIIDYNGYANPLVVTTTLNNGSTPQVLQTSYDGLGRTIQSLLQSDSSTKTNIAYAPNGGIMYTSNPYRTGSPSSAGAVSFTDDVLGRHRYQCQQDNGTALQACGPGTDYLEWQYGGKQVIAYDELRNAKTLTMDALGRLINIAEPNGASTTYSYDTLDNLVSVTQNGVSGDVTRSRTFTYDSLSRLINSCNPESIASGSSCTAGGPWSNTYIYDANGNLTSKTDSRGIQTIYAYDGLNRLLSKTYLGGQTSTLSSCYQYDGTVPDGIGRLANEWTQPGSCGTWSGAAPAGTVSWRSILLYDPMGRIETEQQCAYAPCATPNQLQHSYDLAGNITYSDNGLQNTPNLLGLSSTFDGAGRLATIASTLNNATSPTPLFQANEATSYGPFGLTAAQLGFSTSTQAPILAESISYDNRGRITTMSTTDSGSLTPPNPIMLSLNPTSVPAGELPIWTSSCDACGAGEGELFVNGTVVPSSGFTYEPGGVLSGALSISTLTPGSYNLMIAYSGDPSHPSQSKTIPFTVIGDGNLAPPSFSVTSINPNPIPLGETASLLITATCGSQCANGILLINGAYGGSLYFDPSGQAGANIPTTSGLGLYDISVHYFGNATSLDSTTGTLAQVQVVSAANLLPTTITIQPNALFYSDQVGSFTLSLPCGSNCRGGQYNVDNNYAGGFLPNSTGSAQAVIHAGLTAGAHYLTVSYLGDGTYAPTTTSAFYFYVLADNQPNPVTLSLNPTAVPAGVLPVWTSSCDSCGTGNGELFVDGTVAQGSGFTYVSPTTHSGYLNILSLPQGTHQLVITYSGDSTHPPQNAGLVFTVTSDNGLTPPGFSLVSVNPNPIPQGESADLVISATCGTQCANGNLLINGNYVGGLYFVNGQADAETPSTLTTGTYSLGVQYFGNGSTLATTWTSPQGLQVVSAANLLQTNITAVANSTFYNDQVGSFTITLPCGSGCRGGQYTVNGIYAGGYHPSNGTAQAVIAAGLTPGSYNLQVSYSGDGTYAPAVSPNIPFTVIQDNLPAPVLTASAQQSPVLTGQTNPFTVSATASSTSCGGQGLFTVDGVFGGYFDPGTNGTATIQVTPTQAGSHQLSLSFEGSSVCSASVSPTVTPFTSQ